MSAHPLDNPLWSSLTTAQTHFSRGRAHAKRYEAEVAPFAAIESVSAQAAEALADIVRAGESIYLVAVAPELHEGWTLTSSDRAVQMLWSAGTALPSIDSDVRELTAADTPDMVALTQLVFPGYFRARTPEMGRYHGIRKAGVLAAMAGERMRLTGFQEISAVCTHPDFVGRGYASKLVAQLVRESMQRGVTPFLHVSESNARARALYERLGFVERCTLPVWLQHRSAGVAE